MRRNSLRAKVGTAVLICRIESSMVEEELSLVEQGPQDILSAGIPVLGDTAGAQSLLSRIRQTRQRRQEQLIYDFFGGFGRVRFQQFSEPALFLRYAVLQQLSVEQNGCLYGRTL